MFRLGFTYSNAEKMPKLFGQRVRVRKGCYSSFLHTDLMTRLFSVPLSDSSGQLAGWLLIWPNGRACLLSNSRLSPTIMKEIQTVCLQLCHLLQTVRCDVALVFLVIIWIVTPADTGKVIFVVAPNLPVNFF